MYYGYNIVYIQHEAKMKSLSETVKDGELRKRQLQEQIDQLNEECAKVSAQGIWYFAILLLNTVFFFLFSCAPL